MRRAFFPGSFDPVTRGHENVVLRGLNLFDEVIVAVGKHSTKEGAFSVEDRLEMLRETFADQPRVKVMAYTGLTSEFCDKVSASALLRGVRNSTDFDYEKTIAQMTRQMHPDLDTVMLLTDPVFSAIHSTVVREVLGHGGDIRPFVPEALAARFPWNSAD